MPLMRTKKYEDWEIKITVLEHEKGNALLSAAAALGLLPFDTAVCSERRQAGG